MTTLLPTRKLPVRDLSVGGTAADLVPKTLHVVTLIPAHNEAADIASTIEALLAQHRSSDQIVVIPNGCTDDTAEIARRYPVTVMELPVLPHKKSEALNLAWHQFARTADVVICLDGDTILPPNAIADWEQEFLRDRPNGDKGNGSRPLGGSSSKFTMLGGHILTRLQRAEFARWTDTALRRGWTSVLAGTGCAISGQALRQITDQDDREGPWTYTSQVEDFELTYESPRQVRRLDFNSTYATSSVVARQ